MTYALYCVWVKLLNIPVALTSISEYYESWFKTDWMDSFQWWQTKVVTHVHAHMGWKARALLSNTGKHDVKIAKPSVKTYTELLSVCWTLVCVKCMWPQPHSNLFKMMSSARDRIQCNIQYNLDLCLAARSIFLQDYAGLTGVFLCIHSASILCFASSLLAHALTSVRIRQPTTRNMFDVA